MYFDFETKTRDVTIIKFQKYVEDIEEVEVVESTAQIFWEVEPEIREWGIKSMVIIVKKIVLDIEYYIDEMVISKISEEKIDKIRSRPEVYIDKYGHLIGKVQFTIDYTDEEWKIIDDFNFKGGSLSPTYVYANFFTKKIEIE